MDLPKPEQMAEYIFKLEDNDPEIDTVILPILVKNGIRTTKCVTRLALICIELYKRVIELEDIIKRQERENG